MPSKLNPIDKIPAANGDKRWRIAHEAIFDLYVLGLITDSEKEKIVKRFDTWLLSHGVGLDRKKVTANSKQIKSKMA